MEIPGAYIFDKLDGRNIRVEWNRKRGFYKYGTRHHLFDHTDLEYLPAIKLLANGRDEILDRLFFDKRWESAVAFFELWQEHSLAGEFNNTEEFHLTLLDVSPYKHGLMGPKEFVQMFDGKVGIPQLICVSNWNHRIIEMVRDSMLQGITFEGVVGKAVVKNQVVMAKAKTQKWLDAIMEKYGVIKGTVIINS